MPQKRSRKTIGLALRPAELLVRPITSRRIRQILGPCAAVFVKEPQPGFEFGEGVYELRGKLLLLICGALGWDQLLKEVGHAEAFRWYADNDQVDDLTSDEASRIAFLQTVASKGVEI